MTCGQTVIELLKFFNDNNVCFQAAGEETIAYLYSPDGTLLHNSLVKRGLADLEWPRHLHIVFFLVITMVLTITKVYQVWADNKFSC